MSGRLGIGTLAPGSKLSVNDGIAVGANYASESAPSNGAIFEGNVGVGSTAPTAKLDVNGGIIATGTVTATSFSGDGSGLTGIGGDNFLWEKRWSKEAEFSLNKNNISLPKKKKRH